MAAEISIEIRILFIPFRFSYGHAAKQHQGVSMVHCLIRDQHSNLGIGEAVPRTYVTGETCASVFSEIKLLITKIAQPWPDLATLKQRILDFSEASQLPFPACAVCALEGALVDFELRKQNQSLSQFLSNTTGTRTEIYRLNWHHESIAFDGFVVVLSVTRFELI